MSREEISKVFDWLEENVNKSCWFEFKIVDNNQITAYWQDTNKPFAQFYIKPILQLIKGDKQ